MNLKPSNDERELDRLIDRMCDQVASAEEVAELGRRLAADPAAREHYVACLELHARLAWQLSPGKPFSPEELHRFAGEDAERGTGSSEFGDFGIGGSRFGDLGFGIWDLEHGNPKSQIPNQQIPSLSTLHSPLSTNFVGGPVFSYVAATLILGVMLLSAWAYTITHDYGASFAINSRGSTTPGEPAQRPELIFVARVTGMRDCRWADPATETYTGAFVPLGRKYALASGLMEITYLGGAKVILEGPCRYEVESAVGGFLALGKLTARVEQRSEVRGQRPESGGLAPSAASMQPQAENLPSPIGRGAGGEGNGNQKQSALTLTLSQRERGPVQSPKPQALRPKTEISKSPNLQISKFTVRTPTAVVTDLGTEFGVAVDENGDTASHVFRGSITVRAENPKSQIPNPKSSEIILAAGESAAVVVRPDKTVSLSRRAAQPDRFTRHMPAPSPTLLFKDDFDEPGDGDQVGKRFQAWTYSFGDGRAEAVAGEAPGAVLLRCDADARSAAIVEVSARREYNFQAFATQPTRITFNIRGGSGGLRNQDGYPHRKWVAVRDGRGEPNPTPMELPGFYVTLALDGRHPAFERSPEQPGNVVFVDPDGKKHFLASWDWTHYDGDGPQTVIIELTRDSYQVEFGDAGMKNLTGSLGGKLPAAGPSPATAAAYCQGVESPAGLELDGVRVERLHRNARQSDQDVRKEAVRE